MIRGGEEKLRTLHPNLSRLVRAVAETWDVIVLETDRSTERQAELYAAGKTKTLQSKHLMQGDGYSHAVDLAPLPVDWNDGRRWYYFGGFCVATAASMDIAIRWGGDWNGNTQVKDQTFDDLDHLEVA